MRDRSGEHTTVGMQIGKHRKTSPRGDTNGRQFRRAAAPGVLGPSNLHSIIDGFSRLAYDPIGKQLGKHVVHDQLGSNPRGGWVGPTASA